MVLQKGLGWIFSQTRLILNLVQSRWLFSSLLGLGCQLAAGNGVLRPL